MINSGYNYVRIGLAAEKLDILTGLPHKYFRSYLQEIVL